VRPAGFSGGLLPLSAISAILAAAGWLTDPLSFPERPYTLRMELMRGDRTLVMVGGVDVPRNAVVDRADLLRELRSGVIQFFRAVSRAMKLMRDHFNMPDTSAPGYRDRLMSILEDHIVG
jgi:hypothetical protein